VGLDLGILRPVTQAMRAGKGKVLVGAGVSMQSGLSSWLSLLAPTIKDGLGIELNRYDDLPEIAQFYCDRVPGGRSRLLAAVAADVNRDAVPAPVHMALRDLPVAEYWTTNFDTLLERSLPRHTVVESDEDMAAATRATAPILVKMHGTLPRSAPAQAQVDRAVLTRDDFDQYQQRYPRLWSRIAAGYLSGSMLFLGLSLNDPNMRLLLQLARAAQASGVDSSSVVVMKVPDSEQDRLRFEPRVGDLERSGITVLRIRTHEDLAVVLAHLREMLRPPRVIVSGSTNSLDPRASSRAIQAAELLGMQLAQKTIPIAHGGSDVGATLSRRMAETSDVLHRYDASLITAVRRRILSGADYIGYPPGPGQVGMPRDGTIRFIGSTPEEMRAGLLALGCVVAVIDGGTGTLSEISQFKDAGLAVIPWPATGGTAAADAPQLDRLLARGFHESGALMN